ncbi:BCCT family transporter [Roseisalinus antarcticus]|uniref:BCCT family transporter n=1 Tax=Roseisalinus antarcticus TaxID=254357 RepID=A0A1Y5TQD3_9RHOB|nr:BCCT family transporter [Roseisalinus antarcticus]SLN69051.1 BCCT family transporter [Roseisalinus antarcticus]
MAFFVLLCFALALWPAAGRLRLEHDEARPEFSNFSWFSMRFGTGMLTFATAGPMYHFASNPATIQGLTEGSTAGDAQSGRSPYRACAVVDLALALVVGGLILAEGCLSSPMAPAPISWRQPPPRAR